MICAINFLVGETSYEVRFCTCMGAISTPCRVFLPNGRTPIYEGADLEEVKAWLRTLQA